MVSKDTKKSILETQKSPKNAQKEHKNAKKYTQITHTKNTSLNKLLTHLKKSVFEVFLGMFLCMCNSECVLLDPPQLLVAPVGGELLLSPNLNNHEIKKVKRTIKQMWRQKTMGVGER